jgi:hypothetical protein
MAEMVEMVEMVEIISTWTLPKVEMAEITSYYINLAPPFCGRGFWGVMR